MKRKFVTNLLLLLFLNLLVKPFWIFGIDRTVQNIVGDENYGLYFALFNFSMILNIILDLGITNYNNRNISQHNFMLNKQLSNLIGLKFLLAIFYAIITITLGIIIGYKGLQIQLLAFLILNQFLVSFILYLRSNISGLHLFRTDSLISVLDRVLMIVICGLLIFSGLLGHDTGIKWFVYAQTIAYGLTTVITLGIVLHKSGKISLRINSRFFMATLRKSTPFALLILLMSLYNRLDSVMLERLLPDPSGKTQAGIYAQSFRLLDAASMFGFLFAGLLLPIFSKMLKKGENIRQILKLSYSLIIVPAIILAIACLYYHSEIIHLLYTSANDSYTQILGILMTGFTGIASTYIFGTLLTANGSLKQLNLMALGGMVLNISLNLILIPKFMSIGAAYTSLTTQILTAAGQIAITLYIFKIRPGIKFPLQLLVFTGMSLVLGYLSRTMDNWITGFLFFAGTSLAFAFMIRLLNLRDLYKIIRYE